jgi:hypothetical protein
VEGMSIWGKALLGGRLYCGGSYLVRGVHCFRVKVYLG